MRSISSPRAVSIKIGTREAGLSLRRANAAHRLEAADAGQHHVQHNQRGLARKRTLDASLAIVHGLDAEPFAAQVSRHQIGQFGVVVHNQNLFHGLPRSPLQQQCSASASAHSLSLPNKFLSAPSLLRIL